MSLLGKGKYFKGNTIIIFYSKIEGKIKNKVKVNLLYNIPTKNKAAYSGIILLIKNVSSCVLWQFTT